MANNCFADRTDADRRRFARNKSQQAWESRRLAYDAAGNTGRIDLHDPDEPFVIHKWNPQDSYAVMDMMRLPLGILTGVGFIGSGAILRKNNMVIGVTTAAAMWFATVVGLCLGGGQLVLGSTAAVLGFLVLSTLHLAETKLEEIRV